ncbi:MAG: hypothetical protein ABH950_03245, partial [Candidatus Altiarchaeota archaeon]
MSQKTRSVSAFIRENLLLLFIFAMVGLAYLLPIIFEPRASGTDVYSHIYYTQMMYESSTLQEFYEKITEGTFRTNWAYNHPFGLWFFGGLVMKLTGLSVTQASYIIPLIVLLGSILLFYSYASIFFKYKNQRYLSIIFFLSMTYLSINLLRYRPSVFSIPPLILILTFALKENIVFWKRVLVVAISLFILCLTHTGTYIMLMNLVLVYLFLDTVIWGRLDRHVFLTMALTIFVFIFTLNNYPLIFGQYETKLSLIPTLGAKFVDVTGLTFVTDFITIFHQETLLGRDMVFGVVWIFFLYAFLSLITHIRKIILPDFQNPEGRKEDDTPSDQRNLQIAPILSSLRNLSHHAFVTPIWIGPLHSVLAVIGYLRLPSKGQCLFLTCLLILLFPAIQAQGSTGALRYIFYFFLILPISATFGYEWVDKTLQNLRRGIVNSIPHSLLIITLLITILSWVATRYLEEDITLILSSIVTGYTGTGLPLSLEIVFPITIIIELVLILFLRPKRIDKIGYKKLRNAYSNIFSISVFSLLLAAPIIGNMYYLPQISGSDYELEGLNWLGNVPSDEHENAAGYGYRHMIEVFAKKNNPENSVAHGSETRLLLQSLLNTHFAKQGERYTKSLYQVFGINYLVVSERTLGNLEEFDRFLRGDTNLDYTELTLEMDGNSELEKIYSSNKNFSIYRHPTPKSRITRQNESSVHSNLAEEVPEVIDAGNFYLIQTPTYEIRLDNDKPSVRYFGTPDTDYIDQGYMRDFVFISWLGTKRRHGTSTVNYLDDISYPEIITSENQIIYKSVITGENPETKESEQWASLTVSYTFLNDAIIKEIIVKNDLLENGRYEGLMQVMPFNAYYTSLQHFRTWRDETEKTEKIIYKTEDQIKTEGMNFNHLMIHNGSDTGIYLEYESTGPYPDQVRHRGSTETGPYYLAVASRKFMREGQSMHSTQYLTVGDQKRAEANIEKYRGVSLYP